MSGYYTKTRVQTATIPNGESEAPGVSLEGQWPVGLVLPDEWTEAALSFLVSWDDGVTFAPLYCPDGEYTVPSEVLATAEQRYIALDPTQFHGVTDIKLRSGLNGAAVAQDADRLVSLVMASR